MANRIFELNKITFTEDELPMEGSGHNQSSHLAVRCEGYYGKCVIIDEGSCVDIPPLHFAMFKNHKKYNSS